MTPFLPSSCAGIGIMNLKAKCPLTQGPHGALVLVRKHKICGFIVEEVIDCPTSASTLRYTVVSLSTRVEPSEPLLETCTISAINGISTTLPGLRIIWMGRGRTF